MKVKTKVQAEFHTPLPLGLYFQRRGTPERNARGPLSYSQRRGGRSRLAPLKAPGSNLAPPASPPKPRGGELPHFTRRGRPSPLACLAREPLSLHTSYSPTHILSRTPPHSTPSSLSDPTISKAECGGCLDDHAETALRIVRHRYPSPGPAACCRVDRILRPATEAYGYCDGQGGRLEDQPLTHAQLPEDTDREQHVNRERRTRTRTHTLLRPRSARTSDTTQDPSLSEMGTASGLDLCTLYRTFIYLGWFISCLSIKKNHSRQWTTVGPYINIKPWNASTVI